MTTDSIKRWCPDPTTTSFACTPSETLPLEQYIQRFSNLQKLTIQDSNINNCALEALRNLRFINSVTLVNCPHLTEDCVNYFLNNNSLQTLTVINCVGINSHVLANKAHDHGFIHSDCRYYFSKTPLNQ